VPKPRRTSTKSVRIDDELWAACREITADRGETITDVIARGLTVYARSNGWGVDPITALERLARLHAAGGITDDEWAMMRRELLARV
jgi:hypothetical protein